MTGPTLAVLAAEAGGAAAMEPVLAELQTRGWEGGVAYAGGATSQPARRRKPLPHPVRELIGAFGPSELSAYLDELSPQVVLASATSSELERAARQWARSNGRPIAQLVDGWANFRGRFGDVQQADWPDMVLVVDDSATEDAVAAGVPRNKLLAVGQPAWDGLTPAPPARSSDVLFVGQPVAATWGDRLGYAETDAWDICRTASKQFPDQIATLHYLAHPMEQIEPRGNLYARGTEAALNAHGTICGMFSSLMIDAFLRGRQVICVLPPNATADLGVLSRRGIIPKVQTPDELVAALAETIASDRERTAMQSWLNGSTARVAAVVSNLAGMEGITA